MTCVNFFECFVSLAFNGCFQPFIFRQENDIRGKTCSSGVLSCVAPDSSMAKPGFRGLFWVQIVVERVNFTEHVSILWFDKCAFLDNCALKSRLSCALILHRKETLRVISKQIIILRDNGSTSLWVGGGIMATYVELQVTLPYLTLNLHTVSIFILP